MPCECEPGFLNQKERNACHPVSPAACPCYSWRSNSNPDDGLGPTKPFSSRMGSLRLRYVVNYVYLPHLMSGIGLGIGWTGPNECAPGLVCIVYNAYFAQARLVQPVFE